MVQTTLSSRVVATFLISSPSSESVPSVFHGSKVRTPSSSAISFITSPSLAFFSSFPLLLSKIDSAFESLAFFPQFQWTTKGRYESFSNFTQAKSELQLSITWKDSTHIPNERKIVLSSRAREVPELFWYRVANWCVSYPATIETTPRYPLKLSGTLALLSEESRANFWVWQLF